MTLNAAPKNIPEPQFRLLKNAAQSVRDIADSLLRNYRQTQMPSSCTPIIPSSQAVFSERPLLLASLIETLSSQKKQEWLKNPCLLQVSISSAAKICWIQAVPNDIKRILSNLLNNAYESLVNTREIYLTLEQIENNLQLKIRDTGQGISASKINNVLEGLSLKHAGEGLGLSTAKKYMEKKGGKLTLTSIEGEGTEIILFFSLTAPPVWFPASINCPPNLPIIIVDNDASIHSLWRQRLQSIQIKSQHFSSSKETINWFEENTSIRDQVIYFIDYELNEPQHNGLTLLEKINPKNRGYLITSHADEITIQDSCKKLNVWLLSKNLISEISITNKAI